MFTPEQERDRAAWEVAFNRGRGLAHFEKPESFERIVRLEVPAGELCNPENVGLVMQAQIGGYRSARIRGDEGFDAQGLEGKAVLDLPYWVALQHGEKLEPRRFRIIERPCAGRFRPKEKAAWTNAE